jgi:plasmid stability protein
MAQLVIRNLDDAVVETLKRRAAVNRRSLAEEVRHTLTKVAGGSGDGFRERAAALRAEIGPLAGPNAVADLRTLRDRDTI